MTTDADDAGAPPPGRRAGRYFRAATSVMLTRILVAFIIVGGLCVGLAAGAHSHNGVAAAALLSFGLALLWAFVVVMRYLGIRRRLDQDPAAEVARLRAEPGRHQRRFFAAGNTTRSRTPPG